MTVKECESIAKEMRRDVIDMTYHAGNTGAHIGGALSMIEIMAVLYFCIMSYDKENPLWEKRDRFILSKGHGVMAQYAAMKHAGIVNSEELLTFKTDDTFLYAHPSMNLQKGIEFSSGSLGQGLSLAVGTAMALKRKQNGDSRVYVLIGDGECDEGSIWEAASSAAHYKLDNLVAIIDKNKLQYDGKTEDVLSMSDLKKKWESFGFVTKEVDGHSVSELIDAFGTKTDMPLAIIANTTKGKGVSFMEDVPSWHNGRLTQAQYELAISEVQR